MEIILFLIAKLGVIKLGLNSAYFKKDNIDSELIDLITKPVLRRTSARSLRAMCIGMSSRDEKFQASYLLRKLSASKKVPFLLIWGEKDNIDRELIDLVTKPVLRRTSARSLRAMCIGMSSRDEKFKASHLLRKLSASKKVPFLLIWGEKDNFIPLFVGKKIANFHRWVKLKIVSNSGHCIHDEDPSVFNRISYEWIRDLKTF